LYIFNFEAFLVSLGLILLAELGDKTQLMVVTLSAQKQSPFKIGLSASIGISCVAIIGIFIGYIFSIAIPSYWIKLGGVIVFFIFGIYTLIKYKDDESQVDIQDENSRNRGRRVRLWDSCMFPLFTLHTSGHNPRTSGRERMRQRIMHKFNYFNANNGQIACVGCGRCIRECPVNMDIREILSVYCS